MIVTLDNLAHRYNCLPSWALAHANTLDLQVLDISTRFRQRAQAEADGAPAPLPNLTETEMQQMLAEVRQQP